MEFMTKPQQAQVMIARAIAAGVPFAWFTADVTYGQARWLQAWLEGQDVSYVMAIRCSDTLTMPDGERRADDLIVAVPARAWQKISTGAGAHGPREFDWADPRPDQAEARPRALAAGPPLAQRPVRDRLLRLLRAAPVQHGGPGLDRGQQVAYRDGLYATDKRAVRAFGGGRQDVADLDLVVGDDHPVDEQFGQLPSLRERGRGESGPDGLAECLDAVGHGLQFETLFSGGA